MVEPMINKTRDGTVQPFTGLTPEVVLDAAASVGLEPDGRLFALNSYENRVYQLGAGERLLVLKFYRPRALERCPDRRGARLHRTNWPPPSCRWRRPLAIGGRTLLHFQDFRFAAFPWMRGRAPGAGCPRGAADPRPQPRPGAPDRRPRALPAAAAHRRASAWAGRRAPRCWRGSCCRSACASAMPQVSEALLERVSAAFAASRGRCARSACTATATSATCCGTSRVRCSSTWTTARWVPRVQDLWMMLAGSAGRAAAAVGRAARGLPAVRGLRLPRGAPDRAAAGAAHAASCRLGVASLARSGLPAGLPLVRRGALLGGVPRAICSSRSSRSRTRRCCVAVQVCEMRTCARALGPRRRVIVRLSGSHVT